MQGLLLDDPVPGFLDRKVEASLKVDRLGAILRAEQGFLDRKVEASLKAGGHRRRLRNPGADSSTERSRPH